MGVFHLLHTPLGIYVTSLVLGLGFASLFYTACQESGCIQFISPALDELELKIYKFAHRDDCFSYKLEPGKCADHLTTISYGS